MKTNKIIELVVAVLILAVAGYVIYTVVAPPHSTGSGSQASTYVKVTPVDPNFDTTSLDRLGDSTKVRDFYSPPDLNNGLNNNQPFGPLH